MKNHIYILDTHLIENVGTFDKWYSIMPLERRRKIDSFYFSKDKRLSLGAGILLHKGFLHEGITNTELVYGENGKPFLANKQDIYFNQIRKSPASLGGGSCLLISRSTSSY